MALKEISLKKRIPSSKRILTANHCCPVNKKQGLKNTDLVYAADLLVKIVKADKMKKNKWSFANVAGLIRQHLGTFIDIIKFLVNPEKAIIGYSAEIKNYQLSLF